MNTSYKIRELLEVEFRPLFDEHKKSVFEDVHAYRLQDLLSEIELKKLEKLKQGLGSPYSLYLGAFDEKNNLVGWTWGVQENGSTFYMVNSAVLKGHRCRGVYSQLINRCIEIASQEGFQLLYSRHTATNNAVIIPKLKAGFTISKMEIDDRYGVLIHLHFYTNSDRRKIVDYRSGLLRPDKKIKSLFKF